jgi:hypothetical protein
MRCSTILGRQASTPKLSRRYVVHCHSAAAPMACGEDPEEAPAAVLQASLDYDPCAR